MLVEWYQQISTRREGFFFCFFGLFSFLFQFCFSLQEEEWGQ
jgi:hypothetical protein